MLPGIVRCQHVAKGHHRLLEWDFARRGCLLGYCDGQDAICVVGLQRGFVSIAGEAPLVGEGARYVVRRVGTLYAKDALAHLEGDLVLGDARHVEGPRVAVVVAVDGVEGCAESVLGIGVIRL